jgi:hypothetical protein
MRACKITSIKKTHNQSTQILENTSFLHGSKEVGLLNRNGTNRLPLSSGGAMLVWLSLLEPARREPRRSATGETMPASGLKKEG